jgi:phosphotriesterase-related protein
MDAHIMTVRGPIDPRLVGPTSMHDHVFWDASQAWWLPETFDQPELTELPLTPRTSGLARWNALGIRDNLLTGAEDFDAQADEIRDFATAGGTCIVDLTNEGISPAPLDLKAMSETTDVDFVAGCGFYVHATHPQWLEDASVEKMQAAIDRQIREGVGGTGVLPGIIGEIGTSGEWYACEERVLRAAARVGLATGTAVNVHTTATGRHAVRIVDVVEDEGFDPRRLIFSHLDEVLDATYHRQVLERGAIVGFDSFGCDFSFGRLWKSPSDDEKMHGLLHAIEMGYEDQLVMGHDVSLKCQLKRFGGLGYDHILRRIVPALRRDHGIEQAVIDKLLVMTPRRLLERPSLPA